MFQFIHAADLHLDSPLQGLEQYDGAPADEIRAATRRALENLVELALDRKVDFVVIAGDLYDGDWKDHNTGLYFVAQMIRLRDAGIPVVMIRGNHDAENRMTKSLSLPDNVELLSHKKAQTASNPRLDEIGVAVHGKSFACAAEYDNLVDGYPKQCSGLFNIGLLHTSLSGADGHKPYAPCSIDDLLNKQYDYWALGHVHNRAVIREDPPIVFPGNIQGRHIRETGAKGCMVVTVDDRGNARLEFESLDVLRWELCEVDATDADTCDDVLALCSEQLTKLVRQHEGMPLAVRVSVTGRCAAHEQLLIDPVGSTNQIRAVALEAGGGSVWIEKVRFRTTPARDLSELMSDDGPMGELMRSLQQLRDSDDEVRQLAGELDDLLKKLPEDLRKPADELALDDPDRLRELLDDVAPLLAGRLMEERP